ncbi:FecR family protein [Terrimonas pollutisoli]|uniref:FecR family protein n=1 Tax=Terrimonas pollutisoli TaxID=3034147 RepID=UPI0023EC0A93|nr:FecR family protein [Terrimonas sp. H1YJ31]
MPYSKAELEEMLRTDAFVLWVLQPDENSNEYWKNWLLQHSDKEELLLKARELVLLLYEAEKGELTTAENGQMSSDTWSMITERINTKGHVAQLGKRWYKYAVAASVIGLLGLAVFVFQQKNKNTQSESLPELVINKTNPAELQFTNNTAKPQVVYLVDGSTITLGNNSSVKYARFLQPYKREVQLEGEAFFDIAKDANRPFYVYVQGIAVKVLGTSFRIVANKPDGKVIVAVKTGKVSVFRKDDNLQKEELVLTPQQQAVFNSKPNTLTKTEIADSSLLEEHAMVAKTFSFENKSIGEILEKLSGVYTVDISYDKEKFSKCGGITVLLDEETLEGKLNILCKVLGATYRIDDNKIFLEGNGCN